MSVLSEIRRLPGVIEKLTAAVLAAVALQEDGGPSELRLEELERSRSLWEAEMEALLLKADSTLKSASNAESRARTMVRSYEKHADPFNPDLDEGAEAGRDPDPRDHAENGGAERVLELPLGLATNDKAHAMRMKFS